MKKIYIGEEITTPSWEDLVSRASEYGLRGLAIHEDHFASDTWRTPKSICGKQFTYKGFAFGDHSQILLNSQENISNVYVYLKAVAEHFLNCEFINEKRPEEEEQSEILFYSRENFASYGPLPIKLIKYSNGTLDLHRQTGSDFDRDINIAEGILKEMRLCLPTGKVEFIGPTGAYITVEKIKDKIEETYKESFNKMMGDPLNHSILKTEEPIKKLKTKDEILNILKMRNIDEDFAKLVTEELIDCGIIQVAEEEVPEMNCNGAFQDNKFNDVFLEETGFEKIASALRKFARLSWYFNRQANGGVHWVPDWKDVNEYKYFGGFNYKNRQVEQLVSEHFQITPNFFYFKTEEAGEKTLAQMTEQELKLLGLGGE